MVHRATRDKKVLVMNKSQNHWLVWAVLVVLMNFSYYNSLEGGPTPEWVFQNIMKIAFWLLVSLFFWWASIIGIFISPLSRRTKIAQGCTIVLNMIIMFLTDQGTRPWAHGGYNMLCFISLGVPLLFFSGVSWSCFRILHFKGCIGFLTVLFLVCSLWFLGSSSIASKKFDAGLLGMKIANGEGVCSFQEVTPWTDMIPYRLMSWFLGSQKCPSKKNFSTLSSDGVLTVDCSVTATVSILPDVTQFSPQEKKALQDTIMANMQVLSYKEPFQTDAQAIAVQCGKSTNYHVQCPRNETIVNKVKKQWKPMENQVNVMVLFFDAASRRNFIRRLPKTVRLLENIEKKNKASLFQYMRYHSVGLNTDHTSRCLFSGARDANINRTSVWQMFERAGYATMISNNFCEDWSMKYWGNLVVPDHENGLFCMPEYHDLVDSITPWKGAFSIQKRCLGPRYVHTYVTEYMKDFWSSYSDVPKFAVGTFLEAHEGTSDVLALVDDDLEDFLGNFKGWNDTIVWIIGDHGLHMGLSWLLTDAGRLEHMLPVSIMMVPKWFPQDIQDNLKNNQQSLVTACDFYATLDDLLGSKYSFQMDIGKTMFKPIPITRTCEQAGVPIEMCKCK